MHWAPGAAILVLLLTAAVLLAAAFTAHDTHPDSAIAPASDADIVEVAAERVENADDPEYRDTDLQLYDVIAERVATGENYYAVAVEEQRARDFPVRPGLAVRLPTLAYVNALIGQWGLVILALALAIGTLIAWHYRLRDEEGGPGRLRFILLLLLIGAATGMKPQYLVLHEVWAGMLIALSLGLYRPRRWGWALVAAALALSIRELALPYVLLMGALALLNGRRGEFLAWLGLTFAFVLALAIHLLLVSEYTTAADPASSSWLALRGLGGWTSNIVLSSPLYLLPNWLAAPMALLPLLGWAGWRSSFGLLGFLLCLGYGVAFMIAGRDNNFYWALVITPVWFVGYAFVPLALSSLWSSARGR